jgi:hypothetical protein
MELDEATRDGPAFWVCHTCSYNNDASAKVCEMCNAQKPKITTQNQKKVVSLWACPLVRNGQLTDSAALCCFLSLTSSALLLFSFLCVCSAPAW